MNVRWVYTKKLFYQVPRTTKIWGLIDAFFCIDPKAHVKGWKKPFLGLGCKKIHIDPSVCGTLNSNELQDKILTDFLKNGALN